MKHKNRYYKFTGCCVDLQYFYSLLKDGQYTGWFWGYANITAAEVRCLSFHGHASKLKGVLENLKAR
jgi:hypothetical protein